MFNNNKIRIKEAGGSFCSLGSLSLDLSLKPDSLTSSFVSTTPELYVFQVLLTPKTPNPNRALPEPWERECDDDGDRDSDDSIEGKLSSSASGTWRQSNPHPVSSVSSCKEEEGEWRHDGGRPCMPPAVAGRTHDERR